MKLEIRQGKTERSVCLSEYTRGGRSEVVWWKEGGGGVCDETSGNA